MTRMLLFAGGMTIAALAAGPADAADALLVEKLAPEIGSRCEAATGRISPAQLGEALEASEVAPLTYVRAWAANPPMRIARAAFSDAGGPNAASLNRLQRLVQTWTDPTDASHNDFLPLESGGVRTMLRNGASVPAAESEAVLAAILSGDDSRYAFACTRPADAPPATPEETGPERARLALARTPDDLQLDLTDKSFAEFSYVRNEETNENSYGIHATLGIIGPMITRRSRPGTTAGPGTFIALRPIGFVQYEREGSSADTEPGVNNLNFGGQVGGFIQTRNRHRTLTHYYALSARYLTDDHFDSSAWSLTATVTPQIPIAGNDVPYDFIPNRLRFRWLLTGAADHFSVSNPGRKTELQDANEFTRLGFDLDSEIRLLFGEERDGALSLRGEYQLREAIGGSTGDARLLRATLGFQPVPHVSVGLTYTRGENIDSLEFGETWEFSFGLRW